MLASVDQNINSAPWFRIAALALVIAGLGLPLNDLLRYGVLLLSAVAIFGGALSLRMARWVAALGIVIVVAFSHWLLPAPRIEEGHNVFIVDSEDGAMRRGLPAEAYRSMLAEFDAAYPRERRCDPHQGGCWRAGGFPDRAYAFSADGLYDHPVMSRRVGGIDFTDPVWLRLGFINEGQYNWFNSDIERNAHKRPWWNVFHRWVLTMPYFIAYRFPVEFVGSKLCWSGEVLWEGAGGRFTTWRHATQACRTIEKNDVGRTIFGVAIASPLEMLLTPPAAVELRQLLDKCLRLLGVAAVLALLVRIRRRQFVLPFAFIGMALVVVVLNDASFVGGVHPFEGGDDGLFYEGMARRIVQYVVAGDFRHALEGGEAVFYYGGPGLRYLRALEHFIFGDSFLGYLSLMLAMPFLVFAAIRRFLGLRVALALTLIFLLIPVGAVFGTTFYQYAKWAARGFADPAAAALFVAGLGVLVGPTAAGPGRRIVPALSAGFLFALALWLRPNLAPGAAVLLGGAGIAALWNMQVGRLAGLCVGFVPVFGMALHNWIFGKVFVLFSSNATIADVLPVAPRTYATALGELLYLNFTGPNLSRVGLQWARWLAGPSESFVTVPLHIAAIVVLIRVAVVQVFDPWLRLIALATLALHLVAWFYTPIERYHYLTWFLTFLVCAVWVCTEGAGQAQRRFPKAAAWYKNHPVNVRLLRALDQFAAFTGVTTTPC